MDVSANADSVRELEDLVATLNTEQLRRLARLGAIARLEQLKQEEAAIRAEFPELFGRGRRRAVADVAKPSRRRAPAERCQSAARKAVSERMRKYWAERRKGEREVVDAFRPSGRLARTGRCAPGIAGRGAESDARVRPVLSSSSMCEARQAAFLPASACIRRSPTVGSVPSRGFGYDVGGHVYLFNLGPARLGLGVNVIGVRGTATDATRDDERPSHRSCRSTSGPRMAGAI